MFFAIYQDIKAAICHDHWIRWMRKKRGTWSSPGTWVLLRPMGPDCFHFSGVWADAHEELKLLLERCPAGSFQWKLTHSYTQPPYGEFRHPQTKHSISCPIYPANAYLLRVRTAAHTYSTITFRRPLTRVTGTELICGDSNVMPWRILPIMDDRQQWLAACSSTYYILATFSLQLESQIAVWLGHHNGYTHWIDDFLLDLMPLMSCDARNRVEYILFPSFC